MPLSEIASMLLDWKAGLANQRDASGSTPMHYAASNDNITAVKNILGKAPSVIYIQDVEGSSPLHVAARMSNYSAISCMIEYCPDSFELRDNRGCNFLHIVAQHDGREINHNRHDLKKLTSLFDFVSQSPELKILVDERDTEGNTPLHFASINGFSEVILQLLKKTKANTTLMNNKGKTALDHAASLGNFFLMVQSS
jgi:ankyrin repeat protein